MVTVIRYNGETVAAGETVRPWLMFWTAIRLAPEFDAEAVETRLREIRTAKGVHYERRGADVFAFPPKFKVSAEASVLGGEGS